MRTKKRIIFTLLYSDGYFCQSRNFQCQKVGNFEWLFNNYKFSEIAAHLDELIVINVNPKNDNEPLFLKTIKKIVKNVFIPVSVGGGIYDSKQAVKYLNYGADKIIINSLIRTNPKIVSSIITLLGSQSVVASIDYIINDNKIYIFDWLSKSIINKLEINEYLKKCEELKFGEILLNSVEKDGTGFGFDLDLIKEISSELKLPLIVMGGAGKYEHFLPTLKISSVDAVSTANILNFIGNSIPTVRSKLINAGLDLPNFKHIFPNN